MKKIIFGLLATVVFVCSGNAQNGSYSKSAMTVIVAAAKTTFTRGTSYKDWLVSQVGTAVPAKEEDKFLTDVYNFISTGANSETVSRNYDGKSLTDLAALSGKNGLKVIKDGTISSSRWCIPCLIKVLVDLLCTIVPCDQPIIIQAP